MLDLKFGIVFLQEGILNITISWLNNNKTDKDQRFI